MGRTHPKLSDIEDIVRKTGDVIEDGYHRAKKTKKKLEKTWSKKAAFQYAKSLGLKPIPDLELKIRHELNKIIIQEVKGKKLTHHKVAATSGIARTTITAIMNNNLEEVSIEALLRILGGIGVKIQLN
jgi:predicted XRE-type DNA-binding protein